MPAILGYWDLRGLCEPIRLTLAQAGQEYEMKIYKFGPGLDKSEWLNEKSTLGLDFPNLPYYIDGDVKLTQTLAILRYLARKCDLGGTSEEETLRLDIGEQAMTEILINFNKTVYVKSEDFEASKSEFLEYLTGKLEQVVSFLGQGKFILGDRVTYVDFIFYSTLDYIRLLEPSALDNFQPLKEYLDRIEALPAIEKYLKSESFSRFPITGPSSAFGGHREPAAEEGTPVEEAAPIVEAETPAEVAAPEDAAPVEA